MKCKFIHVSVLCLVTVTLLFYVPIANAQAQRTYDIRHNFWIQPFNPAILGIGNWKDFEHAWAQQPGFAPQSNRSPVGQNLGFRPYGSDWQDWRGRLWNSGGTSIQTNNTVFWVPPAYANQRSVNAVSDGSSAVANSSVSANVAGGRITGSVRSWGSATAAPGGSAYAFSSSNIMIRALTINWRTGQFQWTPAFSDSVSGSASAFWPRPRDPFSFRILDDNDVLLLEDTPIEITSSILEGTGASTAWEEGRLTFTNVMAGEFHVSVNSQYLSSTDTGRADLIVTNGVITTSYDDGIFNGLLPPVGYPGTFDVAFPYSITATYDYPALGANMELEFGGASANTVPEPGTIGLMIVGSLMFLRRHNR